MVLNMIDQLGQLITDFLSPRFNIILFFFAFILDYKNRAAPPL